MQKTPSFWRTETYHALSVHFPIALLSLAAVIGIFYFLFYKKSISQYLRFSISLLLWIGLVTYWIGFYTGRNAYSVVVRTICDPFILKDHLYWAYVGGYLFSAASATNILFYIFKKQAKKILDFITILILIAGTVVICYVGHLGANVVYQQAGGVYVPTENCSEFNH